MKDRKRSCPVRSDRWLSLRVVDGSLSERWSPASGLAARFFCQPHHFSSARVKRGPRPGRDRLGGLAGPIVFALQRSDRESPPLR